MRWYEAWRVALRRRGSGGGDDQVTGVQGLEGASVELLTTHFQVRSQWVGPRLCSEVGRRGLLMASGRDPQDLVPNHLKLVQVGWGYLGEPDVGGVVEDGAHDALIYGHQCFGREAQARPS